MRGILFARNTSTAIGALSTALAATLSIVPASAAVPKHLTGVYVGGGTAPAQIIRQLLDCYGNHLSGDGFTASSSFHSNPPTPGLLPTACAKPAVGNAFFEGLYAGTSAGRGQQGYVAHDADQWWAGSGTTAALPSTPPPYTDSASSNTYFNAYPYPSALLAINSGDTVLPNPLQTTALTFQTPLTAPPTVTGTATVAFDAADFGPAIQVPFVETAIALAVNVNGLRLLQATPTGGTSKVQLSAADVCAIFSGTVTNWNSTAVIAGYDTSGNVTTVHFDQDNNPHWLTSASATPFATHSLPIKVIYRSDSAGVAGTFTSWLNSVCTPLDNGSNHYAAIFHGRTNTFASLFTGATGGALPIPSNFSSTVGNQGVASAVGKTITTEGTIGYLSPDYTSRYSALSYAPVTANLQNKYQRTNGVEHPYAGASFVAPTPAATDAGLKTISPPAAGAVYTQWDLTAPSIDPSPQTSYPIVGFTYFNFYSCYAKGAVLLGTGSNKDGTKNDRFGAIQSFLNWYYPAGAARALVIQVLENNGFHEVSPILSAAVHAEYLATTSANRIGQPGTVPACSGSAKGA